MGVLGVERVAAVANVDDEYSDTKNPIQIPKFENTVWEYCILY